MKQDVNTLEQRLFCYITFVSKEAAWTAASNRFHRIANKKIKCKLAFPNLKLPVESGFKLDDFRWQPITEYLQDTNHECRDFAFSHGYIDCVEQPQMFLLNYLESSSDFSNYKPSLNCTGHKHNGLKSGARSAHLGSLWMDTHLEVPVFVVQDNVDSNGCSQHLGQKDLDPKTRVSLTAESSDKLPLKTKLTTLFRDKVEQRHLQMPILRFNAALKTFDR